ncbi:MAG: hypothetical protein ACOC22_01300 [bacterium]
MGDKKTKKVKKVTTTVEYIDVPVNEKTHIICILDRSGSMSSIMDDSIGGFNTFLKQQKELPDEATITVVLFDDKYELLYDNVDIKNANELTSADWYPRGTTALYDAIGKTINSEKARFKKLGDEKPSKVLVCVVTDGYENASREFNINNIKSLISDCEKEDWNFIYLAANQDAFDIGTSFGISGLNTFTYTADSLGVANMSSTLSDATTTYRSISTTDSDFKLRSKSLVKDKKDSDKSTE